MSVVSDQGAVGMVSQWGSTIKYTPHRSTHIVEVFVFQILVDSSQPRHEIGKSTKNRSQENIKRNLQ